jgi:hypothetical protein
LQKDEEKRTLHMGSDLNSLGRAEERNKISNWRDFDGIAYFSFHYKEYTKRMDRKHIKILIRRNNMKGEKFRTLIIILLVVFVGSIFAIMFSMLSNESEKIIQDKEIVLTIPDVMMTFWNLNDSRDISILEGFVVNSTVRLGDEIEGMPIHIVTIEDEEENAHTIWMTFDMEPNTYFGTYHNPIIYDYYVQFVVEPMENTSQEIYRCFYYRQIWEKNK